MRINQSPDAFPWTLIVSLASLSIAPNLHYYFRYNSLSTKDKETLTTHILHSDLELLPGPSVLPSMYLHDNLFQLVQTSPILSSWQIFLTMRKTVRLPTSCLGTHKMLSYFIPVLLWYSSFDTTFSDPFQPFINRKIFFRVS